jgi:FKBP-type peptidyl-prolyl cis-trans isomerase
MQKFISVVIGFVVLIPLLLCASRCVNRFHQVYETDNGVLYIVKKEGKGNRPQKGDYCAVKYTAYLNNGKVFDSTDASKRKPLVFKLGGMFRMIPTLFTMSKAELAGVDSLIYYIYAIILCMTSTDHSCLLLLCCCTIQRSKSYQAGRKWFNTCVQVGLALHIRLSLSMPVVLIPLLC